jgi:hypothetical protein
MKSVLKMTILMAILGDINISIHAQTVVLSQNFDSLSLGAFGSLNNYDGGGNPAATIVTPGAGGAGRALEMTARNITSGSTANFGVNIGNIPLSGNTSINLSDYTLSFDLAIGAGDPGGYGIDVGTFSADGLTGSAYNSFTAPAAGTGYQHFTVNMGTLGNEYGVTVLNPLSAQMNIDLQVNGFPASASGTPDVFLDNLQITMTQPVPEPNTLALAGLGGLGMLMAFRRKMA